MSKIEQLIQELCPGGCKTLLLKEIASFRRGSFPQPYGNPEWYDGEGAMPFIQVADVEDFGFNVCKNTKRKISLSAQPMSVFAPKGTVLVTLQGTIGKVAINQYDCYVDRTLALFDGFKIEINKKYFAHQLESIFSEKKKHARGGIIKTITKEEFQNFSMQVPPLPIQQEIVRILDTFTEAQTNLEQELELRKKQYEYYRNQLLSFDENDPSVKWMKLGEIFSFIRNGFVGTVTSFFTNEEDGVRYLEGTNIHNGIISDNVTLYVTRDFHQSHIKNELKHDDILMVQSGHIGECAMVGKKYEGANCHALIIMSNEGNCVSKFYVHYFHTQKGFKSLNPAITGGSIKHVLAKKLGKIIAPYPPIERQQEIVSILGKFESAIQTLEEELALRKKQYEYYREKLLTFN